MNHLVARASRRAFNIRAYFSQVTRSRSQAPAQRDRLQFSKSRLVDFGELPHGEIPNALQFSRPTTQHKLSNGVTVVTEQWFGHQAAVTVAVKAGTRQESVENSSVSQFVSHVAFHGTSNRSKDQIHQEIDRLGGQLQIKNTREITYYTLSVDRSQVSEAVAFLADVILNPNFDANEVEAAKPFLYKNASSMDPERNALESIHYTSFRDHSLGQPSTGIKDNVYSITADQVKQFHSTHYVGQNIVVSGAGDINSSELNECVNKHFGNAQASVQGSVENTEQPFFTPSLMFMRDDELPNTTTATSFVAPSINDPDFFSMNFFKRIIGDFRVDKYTGAHLNTAKLQYNSFHTDLADYPDIILQKPFYFAYSDVGIFGNFLFGNEIWNRQMVLISQNKMSQYAANIQQAEVFRARNSYWNELLQRDDPADSAVRNSTQIAYLDRLISRTEVATRISNMDVNFVQNLASKWFWDKETSVYAWGPLHNMMQDAHYVRQYKRATLGEYSTIRVKYDF